MNKKIEIKMTKNSEEPRYVVCGDGGHTIFGSFKNYDEAARKKAELEKRIEDLEKEGFVMKVKK